MHPKVVRNGVLLKVGEVGLQNAVSQLVDYLESKNFV